jgi:hypothetical protein
VVTCVGALDARPPLRTSHRRRAPSLVRATLHRNGVRQLTRDPLVQVPLSRSSHIVAENGSVVWCARYPGLAGLFWKDRGPSKELGRALCDEVKARFACGGFLTTDELPRYGIGRAERGAILAAAGARADRLRDRLRVPALVGPIHRRVRPPAARHDGRSLGVAPQKSWVTPPMSVIAVLAGDFATKYVVPVIPRPRTAEDTGFEPQGPDQMA